MHHGHITLRVESSQSAIQGHPIDICMNFTHGYVHYYLYILIVAIELRCFVAVSDRMFMLVVGASTGCIC